ncbi:hypothetical protein TYRP_003178 [Tyrophagus putrescentiae]|nr:hypothetical protein TYRP_003178 [Tyrophagus putrescentiae]
MKFSKSAHSLAVDSGSPPPPPPPPSTSSTESAGAEEEDSGSGAGALSAAGAVSANCTAEEELKSANVATEAFYTFSFITTTTSGARGGLSSLLLSTVPSPILGANAPGDHVVHHLAGHLGEHLLRQLLPSNLGGRAVGADELLQRDKLHNVPLGDLLNAATSTASALLHRQLVPVIAVEHLHGIEATSSLSISPLPNAHNDNGHGAAGGGHDGRHRLRQVVHAAIREDQQDKVVLTGVGGGRRVPIGYGRRVGDDRRQAGRLGEADGGHRLAVVLQYARHVDAVGVGAGVVEVKERLNGRSSGVLEFGGEGGAKAKSGVHLQRVVLGDDVADGLQSYLVLVWVGALVFGLGKVAQTVQRPRVAGVAV